MENTRILKYTSWACIHIFELRFRYSKFLSNILFTSKHWKITYNIMPWCQTGNISVAKTNGELMYWRIYICHLASINELNAHQHTCCTCVYAWYRLCALFTKLDWEMASAIYKTIVATSVLAGWKNLIYYHKYSIRVISRVISNENISISFNW